MIGNPAERRSLAIAVVDALADSVQGSSSGLRGSLADGTEDAYSDIDLFWELPDESFEDAIDDLPEILERVANVSSLRFDPMLQNSRKRRLVFVQFEGTSLFWRMDIEVSAQSIQRDPSYDLDNDNARGDDWSLTESALMNVVAAMKYLLRGNLERARESIRNAFDRIDEPVPDTSDEDAIEILVESVGRRDLDLAHLVRQVQLLHREMSDRIGRADPDA